MEGGRKIMEVVEGVEERTEREEIEGIETHMAPVPHLQISLTAAITISV